MANGTSVNDGFAAKVQDTLGDARDRVVDARDFASAVTDNARRAIKQNPLIAVALAVGVGFLLGRWLVRSATPS